MNRSAITKATCDRGHRATSCALCVFAAVVAALAMTSSAMAKTVTVDGQKITMQPKLAAEVPASVKSTGLTNITYNNDPPDGDVVNGKLEGWETDIATAVAAELGLPLKSTPSGAFDAFIPGLQNGRYNSSFTSFIETPPRIKQIDIVTYYNVGTGFAVGKTSSIKIRKPTDVCGHTIAQLTGAAFGQQIKSIPCKAKGLKPATVENFPSFTAAELAVSSGRVQIFTASEDQLSWLIQKTAHQFVLQPLDFQPVPEGAGLTKGIGLAKPVADAVDALIKSGAYAAILKKWSLTGAGLVKKATIYSTDGGK